MTSPVREPAKVQPWGIGALVGCGVAVAAGRGVAVAGRSVGVDWALVGEGGTGVTDGGTAVVGADVGEAGTGCGVDVGRVGVSVLVITPVGDAVTVPPTGVGVVEPSPTVAVGVPVAGVPDTADASLVGEVFRPSPGVGVSVVSSADTPPGAQTPNLSMPTVLEGAPASSGILTFVTARSLAPSINTTVPG